MDWARQVTSNLVRLGHVEWQLRASSAGQCGKKAAAAGFTIDYIGAYDAADQSAMRQVAGLGPLPQVISLEDDGPARKAGLLTGDGIAFLNGQPVSTLLTDKEDAALLGDALQDEIARTAPGKAIVLSVVRGGELIDFRLVPAQVCAARFVLKIDDAIAAHTDGTNIAITTGTLRFAANDDELALVAGHELAHVITSDAMPAGLFGQQQEDAADLTGAKLAHCAGYSIRNALEFWKRLAGGMDPKGPTHRTADERFSRIAAAAHSITCE